MRRGQITLTAVGLEMARAEAKHGDNYMGNLPAGNEDSTILLEAVEMGKLAKFDMEEMGRISQFRVLAEEVGEVAEALLNGENPNSELIQVAAMCVAWVAGDDK